MPDEHTSSRPISEVKQLWVQSVLGWVTAWYLWKYQFFFRGGHILEAVIEVAACVRGHCMQEWE